MDYHDVAKENTTIGQADKLDVLDCSSRSSDDPLKDSLNDSVTASVEAFINHTDPDYWINRHSYITILLSLAFFGIILNSLLIWHLVRRNVSQSVGLSSLVRNIKQLNLLCRFVLCVM